MTVLGAIGAPTRRTMLMRRTLHEFVDENGVEWSTFVSTNGDRLTLPAVHENGNAAYGDQVEVTVCVEVGSVVASLSRRAAAA